MNCQGDHVAISRDCPKWKIEKDIVTLKYTEKISFADARKHLQHAVDAIQGWALQNGFKFAAHKCKILHFTAPRRKPERQPNIMIRHVALPVEETTKFLGLWWDSKLNFGKHITELKKQSKEAINLLRVVAHTKWGGDRDTLLMLYRAIVRSKLDYGCIVYGSASTSSLNKLNTIHNTGLRLALGAFCTSPVWSLYVEANEPPLEERRLKLSMHYFLKICAMPDNPAYLAMNTPSKKVWDMIRKITGKNVASPMHHLKDENGTLITDRVEIANTLGAAIEKSSSSNNYSKEFQSIKARKEKQKINFKTNKNLRYNKKFTMRDLKRSLKKSNNSSPGPDQIHYEILRHLPIETLHILLDIINETWKSDTFPESWREALIISIPKPGKDHFNPLNYRPIALTSCICKTVERMVNERLVWYLEKNGLLAKQQCGYRSNRSTVDHLVRLETFIRDAFIHNQHLVAVFFDLQKAYDTTWKYGILKDLHNMGLRGNLPIFIGNFLSDRVFQIHLGTILSDKIFHQEEGVPQGAILSTTLFNVKINNIVKQVDPGVECSLYVDDFVIMYKSPTIDAIQRKLQHTIHRLEKWTLENGFTISKNKTVAMHFCPDKKCIDPVMELGGDPIQFVKEAKFLGLIWDTKLTFEPHIKYLKARCQKSLNILKVLSRTEWGADQTTLLKIYRSFVRSKLDYGCIVYGSASKTALAKLDPVHNQGLRLSLGAFRSSPVESLYVEAHEPPLEIRREKLALQYILKLKANPGNPAYDVVFNPKYQILYADKESATDSFGIHCKKLLKKAKIDIGEIAINSIPDVPIWDSEPVTVDFTLSEFDKSSTSSTVFKSRFNEVKQKYLDFCHIYTDGSKVETKVASAYVCPYGTRGYRLRDGCSIFTAEVEAINKALTFIKVSTRKSFVIFSDSMSVLQAIESQESKNPLVNRVLQACQQILFNDKFITFCWLPSHRDIRGNEDADRAAKDALSKVQPEKFELPCTDVFMKIQPFISSLWQERWDKEVDNKLHAIMPQIDDKYYSGCTNRKDEVIINRLRIGHTRLTRSFRMENRPHPPLCDQCEGDHELTVKHILIECDFLKIIRRRHYDVTDLNQLFKTVSSKRILDFVKDIGLYNSL